MLLYTRKYIHSNNWVELPIDDEVFNRVEELAKIAKQPTFDQYPMFDWAPGIPILDNMKGNKDKGSDTENSEDKLKEEIFEEISEEEDTEKDAHKGFLISYESDSNDHNSSTESEYLRSKTEVEIVNDDE